MSESELEKEVKELRKDLDTLIKKIDSLIDKSKEKRQGFKDSMQFFISGILGAISALVINFYIAHRSLLWFLVTGLVVLIAFSFYFGYLINIKSYNLKWLRRKKCFKPFQ